jgi:hypothetical protein
MTKRQREEINTQWEKVHEFEKYHKNPKYGIRQITSKIKNHEEKYDELDFSGLIGKGILNEEERNFYIEYCYAEELERKYNAPKREYNPSIFRREWYRRNYPM